MTHFRKFVAVVIACLPLIAMAQDVPFTCSSHGLQHLSSFLAGHPERLAEIGLSDAQLEHFTDQFAADFDARGGGNIVIPVVFHIIHNNGPENITDAQVRDAVRILNDDYNKLNADWPNVKEEFLPIVADAGITFRLAGYDPNGNCTTGITRTVSELTNDGGQDMKDLIDWPRSQYLNIWVAASAQGAAGYSMYPSSVDGPWGEAADGIVLLHNYIGAIGTGAVSRSRALTHEVGHYINLRHCWGNSNDPGLPANCGMSDNVSDTPPTQGWTSCNRNGASCGSPLDNVENYMEYSYCSKMFTNGQKTRMVAALNSNTADRNNLWTASNLAATGTQDVQPLCVASFISDRRVVCAGNSITFTDESYHGVITRDWSFTGGEPAVSTDEAPVITYNAPGVYTVSLTVGNGQNMETSTITNYVTVMPNPGLPSPYVQDLESETTLDPAEWVVNNVDNDAGTFQLNTMAGYSGTHSIRMKNYNAPAGRLDELMSASIDLSQDSTVLFSFRYAFARRAASNDDILRLYVSNNCGETWILRKQLRGNGDLPSVPDQNSAFTPANASQWEQCVVTNITSAYCVSDFRFKFWFTGDGGNDLWIDDININNGAVGVNELTATQTPQVLVLPNPATQQATLQVILSEGGNTLVELVDPTGRTVQVVAHEPMSAGEHLWQLPVERMNAGIYFIRLQHEGLCRVVRFTKQ